MRRRVRGPPPTNVSHSPWVGVRQAVAGAGWTMAWPGIVRKSRSGGLAMKTEMEGGGEGVRPSPLLFAIFDIPRETSQKSHNCP